MAPPASTLVPQQETDPRRIIQLWVAADVCGWTLDQWEERTGAVLTAVLLSTDHHP